MYRIGDRVRIQKGPFLYDRVFVFPGSPGVVRAVGEGGPQERTYSVEYIDREGYPHVVDGLRESDLAPPA